MTGTPHSQESLLEQVRARYARAAVTVDLGATYVEVDGALQIVEEGGEASGCRGGETGEPGDSFGAALYDGEEHEALPPEAVAASLGCGNPTAVAELKAGERVLDLGSGGGIDVLLSARRVGPAGFAYGVDMTDEMLELARRDARKAGVTNVEFLPGRIEDVPLPDASVDVVISNCVINLSVD